MATSKATKKKAPTKKTPARKKAPRKKAPAKKRASAKPTGTAFVLIPFHEPFTTYYDKIIEPAIESVNLKPVKADDVYQSVNIIANIWRGVREATVIVAEMTERNPNVLYELGLAHAIGKPAVLIAEDLDLIPFDLQHYLHATYDRHDPHWGDALQEGLTKALTETLADPKKSVPAEFHQIVPSEAPIDDEIEARLAAIERQIRSLGSRSLDARLPGTSFTFGRRQHGVLYPHQLRTAAGLFVEGPTRVVSNRTIDLTRPDFDIYPPCPRCGADRVGRNCSMCGHEEPEPVLGEDD